MSEVACNLCAELAHKSAHINDDGYRTIVSTKANVLLETDHLVVIPSVGPLNKSHVMIVPKLHVNSFALVPSLFDQELAFLIEKIQTFSVKQTGHSIALFESGAGRISDHAGGCIIHAHIHAVFENVDFFTRLMSEVAFEKLDSPLQNKADGDYGYIWYRGSDSAEYVANRPMLPSQFLRYLYSQCGENESLWNWRRHLNISGVKKVLEYYSPLR